MSCPVSGLQFPGKPGIPGDRRHKDIHMLFLFCHIRILLINLLRMIYDMSYKLFAKAQVALLTVGNDELDVGNDELDVEGCHGLPSSSGVVGTSGGASRPRR